ncbi:hypothetical protein QUF72_11110 [Desulfobacterales bacterium HSG2]|nr:hypothetical protein [Desulfobacterales bacterium HSG2]
MNRKFTLGNIGTLTLNFKAGFLALVFMIASAYAMPAEAFRGRKAPDPERIIANLTRELGLSETQADQVRPIIENQVEQRKSIFEKYSSQGRDGRQAMRGEMETLRSETKTQMASVLTDEQMAKYEAFQEQRRQKKGSRGQRGKRQNF